MDGPTIGDRLTIDDSQTFDWEATFRRHERWLRTVVLARTGEAQAVDEVLQEVAVAALSQETPPREPAPWLYRVAVRQALLHRRTAGRRRKLAERFAQREPAGKQAADPLDWLLADERRALVRAALSSLAPRDAELLLLKYTENWTYRQLAAHLGLSDSAVEARLHRARGRLRSELARREVIEVPR